VRASYQNGPVIQCPACSEQFFRPHDEDAADSQSQSDDEEVESPPAREEELRELRIRQFSTLRRTAYRTRSYFIVGTVGCLMTAVQTIDWGIRALYAPHWRLLAILWLFIAAAALLGTAGFARRVARIQREINSDLRARETQELEAARNEPDFSLLSDGSQHIRNLEQVAGKKEEMG